MIERFPKCIYLGNDLAKYKIVKDEAEEERAKEDGYGDFVPPEERSAATLISGALGELGVEPTGEAMDAGLRALSATLGTSGGERDGAPEIPVFIAQQPAQKPAKAAQKPAKA